MGLRDLRTHLHGVMGLRNSKSVCVFQNRALPRGAIYRPLNERKVDVTLTDT